MNFEQPELFQHGPEEAAPLCSPANDPYTAIEAAQDEQIAAHVRRGTARCCLVLLAHPDGLTDDEAVESYREAYREEWLARGIVGAVRSVLRNWCLLKPNDDSRNRLHKNLNLIHRTGAVRVNSQSGRQNVVFNFIVPPTPEQEAEWLRLAYEEEE